MSRYLGSLTRKSRAFGFSLLGNKKEFSRGKKRITPPGIHGGKKKRKKSPHGLQLQEKQKFGHGYAKAGDTGINLLMSSESRLDNLVLKSGLVNTLRFARQLVSYGHFLVDGKKVNIPSYKVKVGQVITPSYINFDRQKLTINYLRHPLPEELKGGINTSLCYKPAMETRGGGDCVDCNKFFCEKDSIKIKVGEMEGKTLYGVRCKDCDDKRPCGHCPAHSRQELEPYLQKLDLVAKSFGGKLSSGYGKSHNYFYYLFAQSAKNEKYRQEVVTPTIAEILGGQFHQEINVINTGSAPGTPGITEGKLEVEVGNEKYIVLYVWTDGSEALAIKEKELTEKSPADNQQDNNKPSQNNNDNSPPGGNSPPPEPSNQSEKNKPNYTL
ncbi:27255_t:CDS:2 [Gigaspora margarita]|uniref:27255_t:CDS:1 n=1 Tax=Gigaspora margarita TaxID=4874 RepID=A0ABM8VVJ7_GIGMA|nr:27255_t:CDS:2 [Gigaspora margarita]